MEVKITKDCRYSFNGSHVQTLKAGSVHDLLDKDVSIIVDDLKSGEIVSNTVEEQIEVIESPTKSIFPPIFKKSEPEKEEIKEIERPTQQTHKKSEKKKRSKRKRG